MKIVRLTQEHAFKPFDCGEGDLNDFLLQDAKQYAKGLLAVTYVIEDEESTVAFFSLSNDRISLLESDKATWRRIRGINVMSPLQGRDYCVHVRVRRGEPLRFVISPLQGYARLYCPVGALINT